MSPILATAPDLAPALLLGGSPLTPVLVVTTHPATGTVTGMVLEGLLEVDPGEIRSGGPPPDGIPPLDDPRFERAATVDWLVDEGLPYDEHVRRVELALINRALERTGGNKRRAAALLNMKRTTLVEKLKRLRRD